MKSLIVVNELHNPLNEGGSLLAAEYIRAQPPDSVLLVNWSTRNTSFKGVRTLWVPRLPFMDWFTFPIFVMLVAAMSIGREAMYFPLCTPRAPHRFLAATLGVLAKTARQAVFQYDERSVPPIPTEVLLSPELIRRLREQGHPLHPHPLRFQQPKTAYDRLALREKYSVPADAFVALHIGHLKRERGMLKIAAAAQRVPEVLFLYKATGHDPERDLLGRSTDNLVILSEFIPDIHELYAISDVYLFAAVPGRSSIDMPLTVLEALNAGLTVVVDPNTKKSFKRHKKVLACDFDDENEAAELIRRLRASNGSR